MIFLRPATMQDADKLLEWRNDPETCFNSRNTNPIPARRHALWMDVNVRFGYPTRRVFMAETGEGNAIGVIDFAAADRDMKSYEVAITVAPMLRGRGYGQQILTLGTDKMRDKLLKAEIRSENGASKLIFCRCGFELVIETDGFAKYKKEPL